MVGGSHCSSGSSGSDGSPQLLLSLLLLSCCYTNNKQASKQVKCFRIMFMLVPIAMLLALFLLMFIVIVVCCARIATRPTMSMRCQAQAAIGLLTSFPPLAAVV